jgi:divalent metal cation (Fe/Co/Zn/Cd) transporter
VILHEAYEAFFSPRTLNAPVQGMALNGVATLINATWSAFLITVGRRWRSPALVADGRHIFSDVVTSVGVLFVSDGPLWLQAVDDRTEARIIFIDFHLVVSAAMSVGEAHLICDRLEVALHEQVKDCSVTIHVEPESEAQHKGVVVV